MLQQFEPCPPQSKIQNPGYATACRITASIKPRGNMDCTASISNPFPLSMLEVIGMLISGDEYKL